MEVLDIVNEKDEVIGKAPRDEIYKKKLTHRIANVIIFDKKGRMALQLRGRNVSYCPMHWDATASGHVRSGESCEEAALRELEEETGTKLKLKEAFKDIFEYTDSDRKGLKKIEVTFTGESGKDFKPDSKDVEKIAYFSLSEIKKMVKRGEKIHPEFMFLLQKHYGIKI